MILYSDFHDTSGCKKMPHNQIV